MQMQQFANHHGHVCMRQDRAGDKYNFLCTKESYDEQSERVQNANAALPQVQAILHQVSDSLQPAVTT